jgi:2-polyprenyl-6-hydroxyphenyl methylase/3-demethylubiquinone-9 3-methyltransferase
VLGPVSGLSSISDRTEGEVMAGQPTRQDRGLPEEIRSAVRAMWALGDYNRFATELDAQLGRDLVEACEIGAGQRVLDVAAGAGNVAIRAAETGANVVASDITVENMRAGEREARTRGVELEWVEADAQALPFDDGEFDVVTSSAGAMFAPDQQAVADELIRVCRPGGTIGMANFTPDGLAAEFFGVLAPYLPPPPDAPSPLLWGDEAHVRRLFGERVSSLEASERSLVETVPGAPADYCDFYRRTFGPVIASFVTVEHDPERRKALDREFLEFATRANTGPLEGPTQLRYEYLLILARKRS